MEQGLLAHLSYKLTQQHEVIATEGLVYILQKSEICRRAVRQLARNVGCDFPEGLFYYSEVSGDNLERPDIVGSTGQNEEVIIIEGKFYAGLTDNQPNAYLDRLIGTSGALLMFVVPELRVEGLWREVISRAKEINHLGVPDELPDGSKYVTINENRTLMMICWSNLLNTLLQPAHSKSDVVSADISQLISLCNRIEGEAFQPFSPEELTSNHMARRNRDLCDLVDAITERLIERGELSVKGMKATPQRNGYRRYVRFGGDTSKVGGSISLDYDAWATKETSPLWLEPWKECSYLRAVFEQVALSDGVVVAERGNTFMLPLSVKPKLEFAKIVEHAAERVSKVIAAAKM